MCVCVCVCVCVCMFGCVCMYMYIYIYTYIYTHIHTLVRSSAAAHTHETIHTYKYTPTHIQGYALDMFRARNFGLQPLQIYLHIHTYTTQGFALDMFGAGDWGLLPLRSGGHRIGLLLDKGMEPDLITRHLQAADAARATLVRNLLSLPSSHFICSNSLFLSMNLFKHAKHAMCIMPYP